MLVVRRSYIEMFRELIETDYRNDSELVNAIRGTPDKPNWQMRAGTAWHACLSGQGVQLNEKKQVSDDQGEFWFSIDDVRKARLEIGDGLWEVPGSYDFETPHGKVRLTATADHVCGKIVTDSKTCFAAPDARDYDEKLQWRVYLLAHHADAFRYILWDMKDPDDSGLCVLKCSTSFRMYPYVGLVADVYEWVARFADWVTGQGLAKYLERK